MFQYKVKSPEKQENRNKGTAEARQFYGRQKGAGDLCRTGLSQGMKEKYESLSGYSFDDVRVHYNSEKPAQMQALAYTQGNQVYLMPGQERRLEHELGHVVQQKRGIVKPTGSIGGIPVNDDESLEAEASAYGQKTPRSFAGGQGLQTGRGGLVAQRYKKAGVYTLAAEPEHPAAAAEQEQPHQTQRLLMVKDNEPGALYIHASAGAGQIPGELRKLGILPCATQVDSPLPDETPAGQFRRYEQNQIPNIIDRGRTRQPKPEYSYTWWDRLASLFTTPQEDVYLPQVGGGQPRRGTADRERAEALLGKQRDFLRECLSDGEILRAYIQQQQQQQQPAWQAFADRWKSHLDSLLQTANVDDYIARSGLGTDVRHDVNAIYGAAQRHGQEDGLIVLDIATEDLEYRLAQVEQEIRTAEFMPQIPTACDTSASMRSRLINGVDEDGGSAKASFDIDAGNPFMEIVDWSYHYATPIPASSLTRDMLIIEDAVGKSMFDKEIMNAHWSAHIYGAEEGAASEIALNDLQRAGNKLTGVSRCRFNQMSDAFRQGFCESHGIDRNDSSWFMKYDDKSADTVYGTLKFYFDDNWKISYELEPKPDKNFTPGMQHFLITTADAVAEDFVLKAFAGQEDEVLPAQNVNIILRPSPETRYDYSSHSLEEYREK